MFGLTLTMTVSAFGSRADQDEMLARMNESARRRARQGRRSRWSEVVAAQLNAEHLGERPGLFVIIVLGEAMLQGVRAVAAIEDWQPGPGAGWGRGNPVGGRRTDAVAAGRGARGRDGTRGQCAVAGIAPYPV